jgi:putative cell wall-binding protein
VLWDIPLADFFLAAPDEVIQADPRVVFDQVSNRWFISALSQACGPGYSVGITYLAVSSSSNLLDGGWTVHTFSGADSLFDYPSLGIASDKVVIGTNVFEFGNCDEGDLVGADLLVISKADLLSGVDPDFAYDPPDASLFTNMPATNLTSDSTVRVVSSFTSNGDVAYFTVTGTPDAATTAFSAVTNVTSAHGVPAFGTPPAPRQPGSPSTIVDAVDGRPTDALWAEGRLHFSSTTNCTPAGDSAERACARITTLTTGTLGVFQDFTIELVGKDTFTPGIGLTRHWDVPDFSYTTLFVTYARSAPGEFVSTYGAYQSEQSGMGPNPNELRGSALLVPGAGTYEGTRWGDYHQLGATADGNFGLVWQATQYPTAEGGWATWISRVRFDASAPPTGSVFLGEGRSSTIYRQVQLRTYPVGVATQVLVSNSPVTSGGVLADAIQFPLTADQPWLVDAPAFGGTSGTGTKTVYAQFGDGTGTWSNVFSDSIDLISGGVQRLAGSDRYATAANTSAATFNPGLPTVFLTAGLSFPDALAGGPVAGRDGIPILLVQKNAAPASTMAELGRLQPAQIVILGGTGVVSNAVGNQVAQLVNGHVYRIAGANRYATASAISATYYRANVPRAYVANGLNFPDALAGAAAAAHLGAPLLLVSPTTLPAETAAELNRLNPAEIIVLGGIGSVSDAVKASLGTFCGCTPIRIGGANRYATASLVAHEAWTARPGFTDVEVTFVATGVSFPDALAGAAAAGLHGGPLVLVSNLGIPAESAAELLLLGSDRIVILGGTGVVPATVAAGLLAYADEP